MRQITQKTERLIPYVLLISILAFLLVVPLSGCSNNSNSGKVMIDGKEMSYGELETAIEGNQPSVCKEYIGKEISATGKVIKVSGPDSLLYGDESNPVISRRCDKGYVELGTNTMVIVVELTDELAEIASTLKKGDEIAVSGKASGFNRNGGISYAHILSSGGQPNGTIKSSASK